MQLNKFWVNNCSGSIVLPEIVDSILIDTKIGRVKLTFSVVAPYLANEDVSIIAAPFSPELLPGMSVQQCRAIMLVIDSFTQLHSVNLSLSVDGDVPGYPCTDQGLEAQEWSDGKNLVVIGTEDGEALGHRLRKLDWEDKQIVDYTPNSMTMKLDDLPKLNRPSFHFIIAENDYPEPAEDSAWFAVFQNHKLVLAQCFQ